MNGTGNNILPLPMRLALAYSPAATRMATGAIFALDSRLAQIGLRASEAVIAQLRLAWWRDQFMKPVCDWPSGEPLLSTLAATGLASQSLAGLVDGWEAVHTAEACSLETADALAQGRVGVWHELAAKLGLDTAAMPLLLATKRWSVAELAGRMPDLRPAAGAADGHDAGLSGPARLPRQFRSLAVLDALARRAISRRTEMLDGPAAMALAMRVGFFGR